MSVCLFWKRQVRWSRARLESPRAELDVPLAIGLYGRQLRKGAQAGKGTYDYAEHRIVEQH